MSGGTSPRPARPAARAGGVRDGVVGDLLLRLRRAAAADGARPRLESRHVGRRVHDRGDRLRVRGVPGRALARPGLGPPVDDHRLGAGDARRARLVAVPDRARLLRVMVADRGRHGPRPVRAGPGGADQAVRSPRHVGDHHAHAGRRVRLDDLPTDHRRAPGRPRLAQRVDDLCRRPRSRHDHASTRSCCPAGPPTPRLARRLPRCPPVRRRRYGTRRCSASPSPSRCRSER